MNASMMVEQVNSEMDNKQVLGRGSTEMRKQWTLE